jgi:D-alanine---D-serine ligase
MISKRLIAEKFPFLLPLRRYQRKLFFYMSMRFDGRVYAKAQSAERLANLVYCADSRLYNADTGFSPIYQENKVYNLKLLAKKLDGLLIRPGETFSFWQAARHADRQTPYKDGLVVKNGELCVSKGGGLCQMSNLLHFVFLHSPLTVVERHGHTNKVLQTGLPCGMDATVSEGRLDLKAKNDTAYTFQIGISFDDENITVSLFSDRSIKPKIAVIFGGCSPEYDISLKSAHSVISYMDKEKYEPVLLGISRLGQWFKYSGSYDKILNDTWNNPEDCVKAIISPDRKTKGILVFEHEIPRIIKINAAMPLLHGKNGEDGTIQGLLELAGIPIIGCNTLSSALCMDKVKARKLVGLAGVRIPNSFVLKDTALQNQSQQALAEKIGYPLFVKPVNGGSSFGITKVIKPNELHNAVKLAFEYDDTIIIEENIEGFEVGCAVLGASELIIGEVDEIELAGGFFDSNFLDVDEKNTLETAKIHVPARISADAANQIRQTAALIYKTLDCSGFARVDMFLAPGGEIVFNEVNTIPGFMPHSRYPNSLKAAGMSLTEIIDKIIETTIAAS